MITELTQYQRLAMRTSNPDQPAQQRRMIAALGLAGEAGEVADLIKKEIGHRHGEDREKVRDELSDVLWYLAEIADCYGFQLSHIAQHNITKLVERYPDGFCPDRSKNRDT